MPRGRRGGSSSAAQEPAPEPRDPADGAGVGHRAVVGRAAGRRGAHRVHGRLRQVLRRPHALLQPQAAAGQVCVGSIRLFVPDVVGGSRLLQAISGA